MLAAAIRPIFNASDTDEARALLGQTIDRLESPLPKVAAMLLDAEEDLLGLSASPAYGRGGLPGRAARRGAGVRPQPHVAAAAVELPGRPRRGGRGGRRAGAGGAHPADADRPHVAATPT